MQVGIIGAGPAGISAAVFLKRYGIDVALFEKKRIGGLINNAWRVENIPFFQPLPGKKIVENMKSYLELYNVNIIFEEVKEVYDKRIITEKDMYYFDYIIVASGTVPNRIEELEGERVYYEFLDLPEKIESLAIYGAGDVAFDGAIQAKILRKNVHIFNRSNRIKALSRLVNIASSLGVIYHESEPIQVVQNKENYVIIHTKKSVYKFDALLLATGRKVDLSFLKTDKVFLIGDVAHPNFRQASIAMGDGIKIAMKIIGEGKV